MRWRKVGTGAALALSVVALSGCVVFVSPPTAKQKKGSVVFTVRGCASQSSGMPSGSCTNEGNTQSNAATDPTQVFLAFRVRKGSKAPHSFLATTGPASGGPTLHFTFNASYVSELQRLNPAPAPEMWVGYVSRYVHYSSTTGNQNFTAKVPIGLPLNRKGQPVKGTFKYEVVVGGRAFQSTTAKPPSNQPVNCMDSLTTGYETIHNGSGSGHNEAWVCVDDSFSSSLKLH
jgi:hypothetical protein